MTKEHLHHTHPEVIKRLRRAQGHLRSTIEHLEEGRSCTDLAQQLHAVEKAIANAKKLLIHDHIDHCLEHSSDTSPKAMQAMITEFKHISKYL
ncbi:MAG: metal-sensing transcriptional repressor [Candidatus Paracaedimonas acanthamoebae]|jgi:DNA-binding FrmR family transcriptional regulator|uniref:Metal-sensing transcriptional repressor n=1 Tax=Candidatus Paracaedimonas acanthamoebae TaxID=244581 RepID=A0A8J7PR57_9PROT|nr:metal-sensing transcriptional repressor [Candidatus Paracaedimonas acanthamoebae]